MKQRENGSLRHAAWQSRDAGGPGLFGAPAKRAPVGRRTSAGHLPHRAAGSSWNGPSPPRRARNWRRHASQLHRDGDVLGAAGTASPKAVPLPGPLAPGHQGAAWSPSACRDELVSVSTARLVDAAWRGPVDEVAAPSARSFWRPRCYWFQLRSSWGGGQPTVYEGPRSAGQAVGEGAGVASAAVPGVSLRVARLLLRRRDRLDRPPPLRGDGSVLRQPRGLGSGASTATWAASSGSGAGRSTRPTPRRMLGPVAAEQLIEHMRFDDEPPVEWSANRS